MKTKQVTIKGVLYTVELRKHTNSLSQETIYFKWYKHINNYCKNLTSKEWIRHLR